MTVRIPSAEVLRYIAVGCCTSLLDLSLFSFQTVALGWPEVPSNILGTIVTICVSYQLNRRFVFRTRSRGLRGFLSFAGVTLFTGLVLQSAVIWGLVRLAEGAGLAAHGHLVLPAIKVIAMGLGAVANFLAYRFIFTGNSDADPAPLHRG